MCIQPFYVNNDIVNHSDVFMTKAKTVDVVYEDGVFKPREPVGLAEGEELSIKIELIMDRGKPAREILDKLNKFTPVRMSPEELEELYLGARHY